MIFHEALKVKVHKIARQSTFSYSLNLVPVMKELFVLAQVFFVPLFRMECFGKFQFVRRDLSNELVIFENQVAYHI